MFPVLSQLQPAKQRVVFIWTTMTKRTQQVFIIYALKGNTEHVVKSEIEQIPIQHIEKDKFRRFSNGLLPAFEYCLTLMIPPGFDIFILSECSQKVIETAPVYANRVTVILLTVKASFTRTPQTLMTLTTRFLHKTCPECIDNCTDL